MLPHLEEVALVPSWLPDPLSSLPPDWAGAKQSNRIPAFHLNAESRRSQGRQQDPELGGTQGQAA